MPRFAILRVEKLRHPHNITGSAAHTFRELYTPNADPSRTPTNTILVGPDSAAGVLAAVKERIEDAEKQKGAVPCIEYLITASPDTPALRSDAYLLDALDWIREKHGTANIVSAVIHRDEKSRHLVAYVTPIIETPGRTRKRSVNAGRGPDGKMQRKTIEVTEAPTRRLSAASFLDGRKKLSEMQTDFAEKVGKAHGLERGIQGSRAVHQRVQRFYAQLQADPAQALAPDLIAFGRVAFAQAQRQKAQAAAMAEKAATAEEQLESARKAAEEANEQAQRWSAWIAAKLDQIAEALSSSPNPLERAIELLNAALRALGLADSPPSSARFDVHAHSDHGARLLCFERDENGEYLSAESDHESIESAERAGNAWIKQTQRAQVLANQAESDRLG